MQSSVSRRLCFYLPPLSHSKSTTHSYTAEIERPKDPSRTYLIHYCCSSKDKWQFSLSFMRLLMIRHAETVDNVAQLYAGSTDSALTVHGSLQAQRLADYLAKERPKLTHIFTSDLQRATRTSEAILRAQRDRYTSEVEVSELSQSALIREQHFGVDEGKPFGNRVKATPSGNGRESKQNNESGTPASDAGELKADVILRAQKFLRESITPLLNSSGPRSEPTVAIVSHGILLSNLWRSLLNLLPPSNVSIASDLLSSGDSPSNLEYPGWTNTGFLEVRIHRLPLYKRPAKIDEPAVVGNSTCPEPDLLLRDWALVVLTTNSRVHLQGLKRTGGGVGSSQFDQNQRSIDGFFKRKRVT